MNAATENAAGQVDRTEEFREALDGLIDKSVSRYREAARGLQPRTCPICQYHGNFGPFGLPPRLDARCPSCGALERHRMIALLVERDRCLDETHRLLHFAPEKPLRKLLAARVGQYETADIRPAMQTDLVLNIEAIDLPDASVDRIVCNHVLEHVDDALALGELYRVLRPGGVAFLTTPVIEGWAVSHEDAAAAGPMARLVQFGQADHVRLYGRDIRDRIRAAGFVLEEFTATEPDVGRYGLWRGETVFIARKTVSMAGRKAPRKVAAKVAAPRAAPKGGRAG